MARRLIGTGTTDANGKVSVSYEGEGAGVLQIVAESGSLLSETYILDDCYFIETGSPTSGYNPSNGTLTVTDGVLTLEVGTGNTGANFYTNYPKTNYPITDFQNKSLTVKADVTSLTGTNLRMSLYYNNGSWSTAVTKDMTSEGLMENSISVPSNVTQVRIRFDVTGTAGSSVTLKDFRLLLS